MNKNATRETKINSLLKQPYPYYYKGKELFIICGLLFVMSLAFNYFFEPFHVNLKEQKMSYFWVCFVHALVAPIVLLVMAFVWTRKNIEEKWSIQSEVIFLVSFLLLVGIGQFLIRDIVYDNPYNWSLRYFYEEIRNTFLVGTLFIFILIPWNFTRLNAKYIKTADLLNTSHESFKKSELSKIEIETNLKDDSISIDINNLLFAKAEGNYVELYIKEDKINRIVKRITMKELEAALSPYSNIIKTHRSFLVNLIHISSVSGNAQGYKLYLQNVDEPIPVSRNMIEDFNSRMKHI